MPAPSQARTNPGGVFDLGEFALAVRDVTDPSTDDNRVMSALEALRGQGTPEPEIVSTLVNQGKRYSTEEFAKKRAAAAKAYQDETERATALGEAETGVQTIFRVLGDLGAAYAGGDVGAVSAQVRKIREGKAAKAQKLASDRYGFELSGIARDRHARVARAADDNAS